MLFCPRIFFSDPLIRHRHGFLNEEAIGFKISKTKQGSSALTSDVSLINTYLDKLPEEQRRNILSFYEAWSIPDVVMSDYLAFGDSVVFSLGEMQAVEMGIPEENYRSMLQTVKNFNTLGAKGKVNYEMKNVGSLFMNHDLFDEVHESLARDFDELNRKYKN